MDQTDRELAGEDPSTAARMARQALGAPSVVARQMIRQARGYDSANSARLTWPLGVCLVLSMSVPMAFMIQNVGIPTAEIAIRWIPFAVLLAFGFLIVRSQRWLVLPMVLWSLVASLGMVGAGFLPPPPSQNPPPPESYRSALAQFAREDQLVSEWKSGRTPQGEAPIATDGFVSCRYIPLSPIDWSTFRRTYDVAPVQPGMADSAWRDHGAAYAADLLEREQTIRQMIDFAEHPARSAGIHWSVLIIGVVATAAQITTIFLVVNSFLLFLSSALARRRNRRDPLLA